MTLAGSALDPAEIAYDRFAVYYDRFTAHHDYELWLSVLEAAARRQGLRGRRLLDVACGTGKSFEPLLRRGYRVRACDLSAAMVRRAAARAAGRAELFVADMRALPVAGEHDLVTCLDDAVNYLVEPAHLEDAFRCAAANLAPGGRYLFDANTLRTYRSFFASDAHVEDASARIVWRGRAATDAGPGGLAAADVECFDPEPGGGWRHAATSRHVQRHHPRDRVLGALRAAGLECLAVLGQWPDGRLDDGADELVHTKTVYVARRAARPPRR